MNKIDESTAGCEIELKSGRICEVQAIGRCATCERAFCRTHQAYDKVDYFGQPILCADLCAPCLAVKKANEVEQWRKYQAKLHQASEFFQSGSTRTALLTAGVQPVKIYQIGHKEEKQGFFGRTSRWVEVVTSIQHGWILGDLSGEYTEQVDGSSRTHSKSGLTALLDKDKSILTLVEPHLDSYRQIDYFRDKSWKIPDNSSSLLLVVEAVKGLIESSSRGIQNVFTRSIPTEHDNSPKQIQAPASKLGFIRIEEGKEPGRMYEIHKAALSIGKDEKSDLLLEDPLANHYDLEATVINQGNGNYALRVEGFFIQVNGQPLDKGRFFPLQEGDRITTLGRTVLVFGMK